MAADHEQVHCIYCRKTEGINKRGRASNGAARYFCTSCAQAFQSEYQSNAKKMAVSLAKQQRDIRIRIQCKVRSKIEAKVKRCAVEQVTQSCPSFSYTPNKSYIDPSELLSTTAYAKTCKLKAKPHLFNYLCQHRVIKKVAGNYELTDIGISLGGQYRIGKDGSKWIVWPKNALDGYVTQLQQRLISDLPFDYLCHMTHIDNVAGILRNGLQSHTNKHKLKDISNLDVNIRRQKKETVNSKSIHSYVPFYFNARNAMLFQVQKQYGDQIVILGYDKSLIYHQGSVYSDGNAAGNMTKFFDELSTLCEHDWGAVFSSNWVNCGSVDLNLKRKMMSEALIPDAVPATQLRVIYCASISAKHRIERTCLLPHVNVIVAPRLFF